MARIAQAHRGGGTVRTYATLSPTDIGANLTLSDANLSVVTSSSGAWSSVRATQGKSSGKWYFEVTNTANGAANGSSMLGFITASDLLTFPGSSSSGMGFQANNSSGPALYRNGFIGNVSGYVGLTVGGACFVAIDITAGKVWFRNSNNAGWALGGDPASGTTPTFTFTPGAALFPTLGAYQSPQKAKANFGASTFVGVVPAGFNAGWYT